MKRKISAIILMLALVFSCAIILSPEKTYAEGEKTFVLKMLTALNLVNTMKSMMAGTKKLY